MTPRELVQQTLEFKNTSGRAPHDLWLLPCAVDDYPDMLKKIEEDFPSDFVRVPAALKVGTKTSGDPNRIGEFTDEFGCTFQNIQNGIIGEVKVPLVQDDDWEDAAKVHIPEEWLTFDIEQVNAFCRNTDRYRIAGVCPRPFERLQFLRGTENLYIDLMDPPKKMLEFIEKLHDFYCRLLTKWAETEVDALNFMDDWGTQRSLLINPKLWVKYFKPMYKDYIDIAKRKGKKTFMHSDGHTLEIYPHLIELGLDAFNSQIFCMGVENLKQFKGQITFWGEIDRQHILPYATKQEVADAVKLVYENLWENGGCIAECEFGAGAKPENVYTVFETWDQLTGK